MKKLKISNVNRWVSCHASENLIDTIPDNERESQTDFAQEGVLMHEIAEKILRGEIAETVFALPKYKKVKIYRDEIVAYTEYVQALQGSEPVYTELRINLGRLLPNIGTGIIDALVLNPETGELHIIDFKTGHTPVFAEKNLQLTLYAYGFMKQFGFFVELYKIKRIFFHIYQPFSENINVWEANPIYIDNCISEIKKSIGEVFGVNPQYNPSMEACKYCPARGRCPELVKVTKEKLLVQAKRYGELESDKFVNHIAQEELVEIIKNKDIILNFIKNVEEDAMRKIMEGQGLPGLKVVNGRSFTVIDKEAVDDIVLMLNDKAYERIEPKLIGVTKLKKLVSEADYLQFTKKSVGKPLLVLADDPRDAYQTAQSKEIIEGFEIYD